MEHRHLNPSGYSLAVIDDIIARGKRVDWEKLRAAMIQTPGLAEKVRKVCRPNLSNPFAQRYYFWMNYVEARFA